MMCLFRPCHGLIFLFKWQQTDTSNDNLVKDSRLDEIFFARQVRIYFIQD
jgi:ubiquitin carboxyl-terminal hydrolase L5